MSTDHPLQPNPRRTVAALWFKEEDRVGREPIGPAGFIYTSQLNANGEPNWDKIFPGRPFNPNRKPYPWFTRRVVRETARSIPSTEPGRAGKCVVVWES